MSVDARVPSERRRTWLRQIGRPGADVVEARAGRRDRSFASGGR